MALPFIAAAAGGYMLLKRLVCGAVFLLLLGVILAFMSAFNLPELIAQLTVFPLVSYIVVKLQVLAQVFIVSQAYILKFLIKAFGCK